MQSRVVNHVRPRTIMTEFLQKFSFSDGKFAPLGVAAAALLWLVVMACAVWSLWAQPFSKTQRTFWLLVLVCLPGVGLLCYLPFSMNRDRVEKFYRGKRAK